MHRTDVTLPAACPKTGRVNIRCGGSDEGAPRFYASTGTKPLPSAAAGFGDSPKRFAPGALSCAAKTIRTMTPTRGTKAIRYLPPAGHPV
ncbi:MAG: hypothetical protein ACRDPJ_22665 [Nocardioidaceae bacterium]